MVLFFVSFMLCVCFLVCDCFMLPLLFVLCISIWCFAVLFVLFFVCVVCVVLRRFVVFACLVHCLF